MSKVKIYVAARYARREDAAVLAQQLRDSGAIVVSTWHDGVKDDAGSEEKLQGLSMKDLKEVYEGDAVFTLTDEPGGFYQYGSHHIEFGAGYAWDKICVLIGPRELMFHRLPGVLQFDSFEDYMAAGEFDRLYLEDDEPYLQSVWFPAGEHPGVDYSLNFANDGDDFYARP